MRTIAARQPILRLPRFFSTVRETPHLFPVVSTKEGGFSVENNERTFLARLIKPNYQPTGWGGFRKIDYDPSIAHVVFHEFNKGGFFAVVVNFSADFIDSPNVEDLKEQFGIGITEGTKEAWDEEGRTARGIRKQMGETGFTTRWMSPQDIVKGMQHSKIFHGVAVRPFIVEGSKEVEFRLDAKSINIDNVRVHELAVFELSEKEYEKTFGIENTKRYTPEGAEKIKAGSAVMEARFKAYYEASRVAMLDASMPPKESVRNRM